MKDREILTEEASIVLVGNMNPKIFHPEWFIRKNIVGEWDYSQDKVTNLPDMAQIEIPNDRKILVLLNQFSIRSSLASEHLSLKDFVIHTFSLLAETPVQQIGMNYLSVIRIPNKDKWKEFGKKLAPQEHWYDAAPYIAELDTGKLEQLGLWELVMNLPRPDDGLNGYIRPKIAVLPQAGDQVLTLSINNHIEIDNASTMIKILEENWNDSLTLASSLTSNIMESQLREE